mgnify:CR=1 FL=1
MVRTSPPPVPWRDVVRFAVTVPAPLFQIPEPERPPPVILEQQIVAEILDADPHVHMRAKRLFGKLSTTALPPAVISARTARPSSGCRRRTTCPAASSRRMIEVIDVGCTWSRSPSEVAMPTLS